MSAGGLATSAANSGTWRAVLARAPKPNAARALETAKRKARRKIKVRNLQQPLMTPLQKTKKKRITSLKQGNAVAEDVGRENRPLQKIQHKLQSPRIPANLQAGSRSSPTKSHNEVYLAVLKAMSKPLNNKRNPLPKPGLQFPMPNRQRRKNPRPWLTTNQRENLSRGVPVTSRLNARGHAS